MSGGIGIHGKMEEGITPRVIRHVFSIVDGLNKRAKPGEKVEVGPLNMHCVHSHALSHDLTLNMASSDHGICPGAVQRGFAGPVLQEWAGRGLGSWEGVGCSQSGKQRPEAAGAAGWEGWTSGT